MHALYNVESIMSLHYILVIRCNIDDSFAMRLNHSKKFNIKKINIFKFGEVVIYCRG